MNGVDDDEYARYLATWLQQELEGEFGISTVSLDWLYRCITEFHDTLE